MKKKNYLFIVWALRSPECSSRHFAARPGGYHCDGATAVAIGAECPQYLSVCLLGLSVSSGQLICLRFPSLSSPYINKEVNKITQSDGTALFLKQDQLGADLTLKINQNISLTGGSLFVKSSLNRLDELHNKITAYSSQPFIVGYEQSLFGYNSLKWNRQDRTYPVPGIQEAICRNVGDCFGKSL